MYAGLKVGEGDSLVIFRTTDHKEIISLMN